MARPPVRGVPIALHHLVGHARVMCTGFLTIMSPQGAARQAVQVADGNIGHVTKRPHGTLSHSMDSLAQCTENVEAPPEDGREALIRGSGLGTSLAIVREGNTIAAERTPCMIGAREERKGPSDLAVLAVPHMRWGN
jgi:hypothetical protein